MTSKSIFLCFRRSLLYSMLCVAAAVTIFAAGTFLGFRFADAEPIPTKPYAMLYPYGEQIGLYRTAAQYEAGDKPDRILPIRTESLPARDRAALENGICVQNAAELRQLTEDLE